MAIFRSVPPRFIGGSQPYAPLVHAQPPAAEAVTEDRWHQPLSEPRRPSGITAALGAAALVWSTFTPPPVQTTAIGWFAPLSTPVFRTRTLHASLHQAHTELLPVGSGDVFSSDFSSDFGGPGASWAETVTEDRWHQPFSLPVWPRRALAPAYQQAHTEPVIVPSVAVSADVRWHQALATPVWPPRALAAASQQAYTAPVSEAPERVTVDRWLIGLSNPVWARPALLVVQQTAFWWSEFTPAPPVVVAVSGWGQPLSRPYPSVRGLHVSQQPAYAAPASEAAETVTVDRWLIGLSTPLYAKASVQAASQQAYTAPVSEAAERVSVDRWLVGLSNPVWARPALPAAQQNAFWWSGLTPPPLASTVSAWGQDLSRSYPATRGLHVSQQQAFAPEPISEAAEAVSIDRWLIGLSLPVWARPALLTANQTAFFAPTLTIDHTSVDRWQTPFSTPVWPKRGLNVAQQQVYVAPVSEAPETTTVDRWHAAFSLPVWPKRGLYAAGQQYQTAPLSEARETTTVDRWHQQLSIPVRRVATVYPPLPQLIFTAPVSIGWFQPMSVPVVMNKIGLRESFRPATFFIPFPPFIPSPDREIYGRGGVRLIYGKGIYRFAIKGKS